MKVNEGIAGHLRGLLNGEKFLGKFTQHFGSIFDALGNPPFLILSANAASPKEISHFQRRGCNAADNSCRGQAFHLQLFRKHPQILDFPRYVGSLASAAITRAVFLPDSKFPSDTTARAPPDQLRLHSPTPENRSLISSIQEADYSRKNEACVTAIALLREPVPRSAFGLQRNARAQVYPQ
jgi:hypothetical protein